MIELSREGRTYHIPSMLNDFQLEFYLHLIDWKREHITEEPGYYRGIAYDAILPKSFQDKGYPILRSVIQGFQEHRKKNPFRSHKFLGHMASSQAACANLFLPLLESPDVAAKVLRTIKPDMSRIATEHLDRGYWLEYWGQVGSLSDDRGLLNDHSRVAGTDVDIAIAYYDTRNRLSLWLIEHKLTETDFTPCRGRTSHGRTSQHRCSPPSDILDNPDLCYYKRPCGYKYWEITKSHPETFKHEKLLAQKECPFSRGLNQLWRNQLLALAVQESLLALHPFEQVSFSVVYHPKNTSLLPSLRVFRNLIGDDEKFFYFTSEKFLECIDERCTSNTRLTNWLGEYRKLYNVLRS